MAEIKEEENLKTKAKKLGIITLGCDKNRVDTEFILTKLADAGYVFDNNISSVCGVLINTCSFIEPSRNEGYDVINECLKQKDNNPNFKVIVCGCLAEKNAEEIKTKFPQVDAIVGVNQYENIASIVDAVLCGEKIEKIGGKDTLYFAPNRKITTPINYAYLKIADGCDNFCTFCRIPYIRGRFRSQTIENLVEEAKNLVLCGATELILVAQDITKYGTDIYKKPALVDLIKELSKIENLKWIRLLYVYPENLTDELIAEIENNEKVCKYVDIPLQHISNSVLKKMNRKSDEQSIKTLISKLKQQKEPIVIRSTFMVGFPGETEEDFDCLCSFLQNYKLNNVGFFKFSKEKGTVADTFVETVSENEKDNRLNKVYKIQQSISKNLNKFFIGKTLDVVVEGITDDETFFVGRCEYQTPDVDGIVIFSSNEDLCLGQYVKVKITGIKGYDLKGETV